MRVEKQLGFVAGAVLIAAFGFANIGQAAPMASGAAGALTIQEPASVEARVESAHYTGHRHTHHRHHHTHHHMHHHHVHHHHHHHGAAKSAK